MVSAIPAIIKTSISSVVCEIIASYRSIYFSPIYGIASTRHPWRLQCSSTRGNAKLIRSHAFSLS